MNTTVLTIAALATAAVVLVMVSRQSAPPAGALSPATPGEAAAPGAPASPEAKNALLALRGVGVGGGDTPKTRTGPGVSIESSVNTLNKAVVTGTQIYKGATDIYRKLKSLF